MIHPATEIRIVNEGIGYGVFATSQIPCGTVTYVQDDLDLVFEHDDPRVARGHMRPHILKYSFTGPRGERVLSWDHAKYMNHSCTPNSVSTGYGFEIAVRDIEEGEEVTDDYGLFMFSEEEELLCLCGSGLCRGRLRNNDIDHLAGRYDPLLKDALRKFTSVDQPLLPLLRTSVRRRLMTFLNTGKQYRSIKSLKPKIPKSGNVTICA